ncbi:hypothetical protein H7142_00675 [Candidatus Saccharibacteria bacterium]|nr:hypothetical protein [Candidatus Saccharibacteria bacterium]
MFRSIVSNLSFSPALVGQLGFYAKRLRKEEATRRLGLVFTALALVVQSLAVFSPPEAANAASAADFISGGVSSKQEFLKHYDNNTNRIKGLYDSLGITRGEISDASRGTISKAGVAGKYNWSRTSLYSAAQGERSYTFNNGAGDVTFFYRPLSLTSNNPPYDVLVGNSKQFGWFAIKMDCGNLITKTPPRIAVVSSIKCELLTLAALGSNRYRATVTATPTNATITGYTLKVDNQVEKEQSKDARTTAFEFSEGGAGKHTVKATVHSNVGSDSGPSCTATFTNATSPPPPPPPTPIAACSAVNAIVANRTVVSLSGAASVSTGASISRYTFVVKNAAGNVVKILTVNTGAASATADSFELPTAGNYSVQLTVQTSLGDRAGAACQTSFQIAEKAVCQYNPTLPPGSPDCQPCPGDATIWIKDEKCKADIVTYKSSTNMTQGNIDATKVVSKASDKISYTLTIENKGLTNQTVTMTENLADVVEYATLVDRGGGSYDETSKVLSWPAVTLEAGQKQTRTIAIQVMDKIPVTNTGKSNEDSYDCTMINTFGNTVAVDVECAPEKVIVEQVVSELPQTGPRENMIFAAVLLSIVTYFYARSRQLGREVRLIRRNLNTGTI